MTSFGKILVFCVSVVALIIVDALWINGIMRGFYRVHLAPFITIVDGAMVIRYLPALLAWGLIVAGQFLFVMPQVENASLLYQFLLGCAYGLVIYGVYDLTNYATMPQWSLQLTIVDLLWGMTINGFLSLLMHMLNRLIK